MKFFLSFLTLLTFILSATAQPDVEKITQSITKKVIQSHIRFLASDELAGRDTNSPGLQVAAKYIESRFVEYGVEKAPGMDSYLQPVPMQTVVPPTDGAIVLNEKSFEYEEDFFMIQGENADIKAEFVFVKYGTKNDLLDQDVKGKIVVAICGDGENQSPQAWFGISGEKRKMAKKQGAVAMIELYNSAQLPWNFLVRYFSGEQTALDESSGEKPFMHLWMNRSANDLKLVSGTASISVEGSTTEKFTSQNVVGYLPGSDAQLSDEVVVYSAHYDHIGTGKADAAGDSIYNGSRDNAVGTVTVLAAAQYMGKYRPKRSSLFVLFTGEEKGLLGSNYFVHNPPIALNKLVYCFNSDNGGYNDTSKATIIGLGRTSAREAIIDACQTFGIEAIDDPAPEQGLFDRSDNVNFASKGIPAPTFSMGFTAFDKEIMKYYHQAGDNPETLDYDYLEKFFRSYVLASIRIGNAENAPFWTKGDKYYDAGRALYDK